MIGCQNFGFGLGWILPLIFWVVIIWLIVILLRSFWYHGYYGKHGQGKHFMMKGDSATDILRERYAKGEISKEDFEKMKKDLQG